MPVKVTPAEFVEKWGRRLKGAVEDIKRGVGKVTEAPSEKAVAKKDKFRAKLIEAIDAGIWERELGRVTLDEWKRKMIEKGAPRISKGVDEAKDKMSEFAGVLLPHIEKGQAVVKPMPDITLDDMIARMEKFIRHMAELKFKGR